MTTPHALRRLTLTLALPLVALAACGSDETSQPGDTAATLPTSGLPTGSDGLAGLDGREYLSTAVDGHDLVADSTIRLSFEEGSLSANAGCNTLFGAYTIEGDTLLAPVLAGTEMACDPALMDQDTWLSGVLSGEPRLALDGDTLVVTGSDSTITMLDRTVADPDRPLVGTRWVVDGLVANQAISTIPLGTEASITITDGQAAVEAGCNTGSASAEITDTTITFGPLALTRMACPPEQTDLENAVIATLDGEVTYTIEANRLSLRTTTDDGEVGLELVAES